MVPVFRGTRNTVWQRHKRQSVWLAVPAVLSLAAGLCMADLASGQPFGPEVTLGLSVIGIAALLRNRSLLYGAGVGLMLIALLLATMWLIHPLSADSQIRFEILTNSALLIITACLLTLGIDAWQRRAQDTTRVVPGAQAQPPHTIAIAQQETEARFVSPAPGPLVLALDTAAPFLQSAQALPNALHTYVDNHYRAKGTLLTFNTLWDEPPLPLTHVNMLFQFALDALRERSAHAAHGGLEVSIIATPHAAWVDVQDNGARFAEHELALPMALYRERAARLGGTIEIRSGDAPRNALCMRVAIPQR
jgi:hypothetical protein